MFLDCWVIVGIFILLRVCFMVFGMQLFCYFCCVCCCCLFCRVFFSSGWGLCGFGGLRLLLVCWSLWRSFFMVFMEFFICVRLYWLMWVIQLFMILRWLICSRQYLRLLCVVFCRVVVVSIVQIVFMGVIVGFYVIGLCGSVRVILFSLIWLRCVCCYGVICCLVYLLIFVRSWVCSCVFVLC